MLSNTKQKIIDGTFRVVATVGLENTTTKKIAEIANISESVMYKYFVGKNEILQTCNETVIRELKIALNNCIVKMESDLLLNEKFVIVCDAFVKYFLHSKDKAAFYDKYRHSFYKYDEYFYSDIEFVKSFYKEDNTFPSEFTQLETVYCIIIDALLDIVLRQLEDTECLEDEQKNKIFNGLFSLLTI